MSGVILCARPEMPLHDALKVKPGLPWSPSGVEDDTGCLLRKASNQAWKKPKREKSVSTMLKSAGALKSFFVIFDII